MFDYIKNDLSTYYETNSPMIYNVFIISCNYILFYVHELAVLVLVACTMLFAVSL